MEEEEEEQKLIFFVSTNKINNKMESIISFDSRPSIYLLQSIEEVSF